jgi:hypothetical protein
LRTIIFVALLYAQTITSASVTGVVRDTTEAVVPGATVSIRNHDTNQVWSTVSDERGQFRLQYLPVGDYHLAVQLPGFTIANANLSLKIGDQVDVPIVLRPALAESVQVQAETPIVEARRTEMASTITPHEVDALPLNGRNYLDLAQLAPNVSRTNLRTTDRFAETSAVASTGVSVSGQRNLNNNFVVDGMSANDDAADLAGVSLAQDVVREFEVITSGGGAEFGRASAGTINVVTQSGTNDNNGRVYEFFRSDALDAKNPLAVRKDPLRQNQFGMSFGGPIVKNRTFWFGNVERTLRDLTSVTTISLPAVAAINTTLDAVGYRGPRVTTGNYTTGYDTTNAFARVDHQAGISRLQVRYNFYDVSSPNARNIGGLNDVSRGQALDDVDHLAGANLLTVFPSGIVNEARVQYVGSRLKSPVNDPTGPAVSISGVAAFGTWTSSPTARDADVIQAVDTVTLQRGPHLIKGGADVLYNRIAIAFPGATIGSYTFSSLANFQRGAYTQFQQAFGQTSVAQSNPNLGAFVQDEWRLRSDLTVDGGVRYDVQWLPSPVNTDWNNVSPRAGIAYAPGGGKTVYRASGGVYFDRIPLRATSNAIQRDGSVYKTAVLSAGQPGAPLWPSVLSSFPPNVLVSITTINPNAQAQRSEQASVQVERAVGGRLSAQVGYSYLRGHEILISHNVNAPSLTSPRPDPTLGNNSQYDSIGDSWFHAVTASLETRRATWGRIRVSYTLSNAQDDAGNAFFQSPQTQTDVLADKGPSDNDQRHHLVVSGDVERGLAGFQLGWVYTYGSSLPFNIVTGADNNGDTTINDRPAGVGRNAGRIPCFDDLTQTCGMATFDLRVSRPLRFGTQRVDLMLEAFNLFNRANVVNVNNTIGNGAVPSPTFKQVTAVGDMRQMQLGVRWMF